MNGTVVRVVRGIADSWKVIVTIGVILGFLLTGWTKVKTLAQTPEKVDSLKIAHDSQTAILRQQLQLQKCLVLLALDPKMGRMRCLTLTLGTP